MGDGIVYSGSEGALAIVYNELSEYTTEGLADYYIKFLGVRSIVQGYLQTQPQEDQDQFWSHLEDLSRNS